MGTVIKFPLGAERKELKREQDEMWIDNFVYQSIVETLSHCHGENIDITKKEYLHIVALIGRLNRMIAHMEHGIPDAYYPLVKQLVKEMNIKKIELID